MTTTFPFKINRTCCCFYHSKSFTVMILSFGTNKTEQTVPTQIRLLLGEQSDQGLHCLLLHLHLIDEIPEGLASI